jgi:hypothetical protein
VSGAGLITSGVSHRVVLIRDWPFELAASTSTTASHPPSLRRNQAVWRPRIRGSTRSPLDL